MKERNGRITENTLKEKKKMYVNSRMYGIDKQRWGNTNFVEY